MFADCPIDMMEQKVTTITTKIEDGKEYKKLLCSTIMYFEVAVGKPAPGYTLYINIF